ncbi:hypothetical protein CDL15_Pgr003882 [Punica granatum]|uniref:Uncharacterized protein n=1 Tax=Punica granatum TaxID=22663 RepID=A0A218XUH9_PUNGR|nr:hypothetical protein CDL15_Pgr003882 [Punica granatum]PKI73839.1 hypothetical protein CRG98_005709 [Punica granatum]
MGIQAGAALSCVEERSNARVSGMRRESGEGGYIRTRTEPIWGGSFQVSRARLNDRVRVRMSPSSPDFLPMLKTLMWHVHISLPYILVDVHLYVPLSGLISKVFFLDLWNQGAPSCSGGTRTVREPLELDRARRGQIWPHKGRIRFRRLEFSGVSGGFQRKRKFGAAFGGGGTAVAAEGWQRADAFRKFDGRLRVV